MIHIEGRTVCESLAEVVSPARAALVVIDIENSSMWDSGPDRGVLDRTKSVVEAARDVGVPVFFFFNQRGPGLSNISAAYVRVLMNLGWDEERILKYWEGETPHGELHPELRPLPSEVVIPKNRASCFEGTDFQLFLRTMDRQSVILTGCSTDWCVEATAWAATNMDYYVTIVEDCVRGPRPEGHKSALQQFKALGLDMTTSNELIDIWSTVKTA